MKKHITVLFAAVMAFVLCSCQTPSGGTTPTTPPDPAAGALLFQTVESGAAYLALKNNPKYVPAAQAMVQALDVALAGTAVINGQTIQAFVQQLAAQKHMDPGEALFLSGLAGAAYEFYAAKYHVPASGILITNASAHAYVQAFRNGLNDAVIALSFTSLAAKTTG